MIERALERELERSIETTVERAPSYTGPLLFLDGKQLTLAGKYLSLIGA